MSDGKTKYTIELIPATGTTCIPGSTASSDDAQRRIRARSASARPAAPATRRAASSPGCGGSRSSTTSTSPTTRRATRRQYPEPDDAAWAATNCAKPARRAGPSDCRAIQFASDDAIKGPFHTNDDILAAARTKFGRDQGRPHRVGQRLGERPRLQREPAHPGHVEAELPTRSTCRRGTPASQSVADAAVHLHGQDDDPPERHDDGRDDRDAARPRPRACRSRGTA